MRRIVYYAHHQGSGHLHHASNMARNPDIELVVMTSRPIPCALFSDRVRTINLTSDVVDGHRQPTNSPFHHTPLRSVEVRRRADEIHGVLSAIEPDVVVSDVSVEVATFAHLAGYPVLVRRMHGDRSDLAHTNAFALANGLIAWFPSSLEQEDIGCDIVARTTYAGMMRPPPRVLSSAEHRVVLVLTSLGGDGVDMRALATAARDTPSWQWRVAGTTRGQAVLPVNVQLMGIVANPLDEIAKASVVVGSGGHNTVRDVAGVMRPLIMTPEKRPHDEQLHFAKAVAAVSDAFIADQWPGDWNARLDLAMTQDPRRLADELFVSESSFHKVCSQAVEEALAE